MEISLGEKKERSVAADHPVLAVHHLPRLAGAKIVRLLHKDIC